jgi:hypothetical protein
MATSGADPIDIELPHPRDHQSAASDFAKRRVPRAVGVDDRETRPAGRWRRLVVMKREKDDGHGCCCVA